jgi:hypothetical protein
MYILLNGAAGGNDGMSGGMSIQQSLLYTPHRLACRARFGRPLSACLIQSGSWRSSPTSC